MHQLQLVGKQIQSSTKALHSAVFPITTMNPHPTTTFRGCYGPYLHSTEGRRQRSRNDQYYYWLLSSSDPICPLHHMSSISWKAVSRIMTSFDLWGPKGERLLFRSSTLTCYNWYWTNVRYKLTHYKSVPSQQNWQVIVRTYYYIINGNLNVSSREIGFPCPGMAS